MNKYIREQILEKGEMLFRSSGYNKTGINRILQECGMPKGSFYNFFTSKEEFALEVLRYYSNNFSELIHEKLNNRKLTPIKRIEDLYKSIIEIHEADEFSKGCLLNNFSNEVAGKNERFSENCRVNFNHWLKKIADCIEYAQEDNEIRNDILAIDLAEYIHTSLFGVLSRMKMNKDINVLNLWLNTTLKFITEISEDKE